LDEVLGGEVRSARFYGPVKSEWADRGATLAARRFDIAETVLCGVLALGSLWFHWGESYRGIELLYRPTSIISDDVWSARSLQCVMALAIAFLLLCLMSIGMRHFRHEGRPTKVVFWCRRYFAWLILILLSFPLAYTLVVRYGLFMDWYLLPALGAGFDYPSFLNLQNLPAMEAGSVSPGFLVFFFSCLFLAWSKVRHE
jgi:hypothetical protein